MASIIKQGSIAQDNWKVLVLAENETPQRVRLLGHDRCVAAGNVRLRFGGPGANNGAGLVAIGRDLADDIEVYPKVLDRLRPHCRIGLGGAL